MATSFNLLGMPSVQRPNFMHTCIAHAYVRSSYWILVLLRDSKFLASLGANCQTLQDICAKADIQLAWATSSLLSGSWCALAQRPSFMHPLISFLMCVDPLPDEHFIDNSSFFFSCDFFFRFHDLCRFHAVSLRRSTFFFFFKNF